MRPFLVLIFSIFSLVCNFAAFGVEKSKSDTTEARKKLIAFSYILYNAPDSLKPGVYDILEISENWRDSITALKFLAVIYDITGKTDSALFYFEEARSMAVNAVDSVEIGNSLMNIGNVHYHLGNFDVTLEYYLMAAEYINVKNSLKNFTALNHNIASLYTKMRLYDLALERQKLNLSASLVNGNDRGLAFIYSHLVGIYNSLGNPDSAKHFIELADSLNNKLDDQWLRMTLMVYKSEYYLKANNFELAEKVLQQKLSLDSIYNNNNEFGTTYRYLGHLNFEKEKYVLAKNYFLKALNFFEEPGELEDLIFINYRLGEIEEKTENYKMAASYFKKAKIYKDSADAENTKNTLISVQGRDNLMRIREELDKANKEGLMLRNKAKLQQYLLIFGSVILIFLIGFLLYYYRNTRIKIGLNHALNESNANLEAALNQQTKLMQVLAHDFRAPLSSIIGIIDLIATKSIDQEMSEDFLLSLKVKIQDTMLNLDKVLAWIHSKNHSSLNNRKLFGVTDVIDEAINFVSIQATNKRILINKKILNQFEINVDTNQLSIILRNILNNAIKFSDPQQSIEVEAAIENGRPYIKIKDNGTGMSSEQLRNIKQLKFNTEIGTQGELGSGMGVQLIYDFAKRNDIRIALQSEEGKGTEFTLWFE